MLLLEVIRIKNLQKITFKYELLYCECVHIKQDRFETHLKTGKELICYTTQNWKIDKKSVVQVRGSSTRLSLVGPNKVKARKSFLFTEKVPCIENIEHSDDFFITFILLLLSLNALHGSKVSQSRNIFKSFGTFLGIFREFFQSFCDIFKTFSGVFEAIKNKKFKKSGRGTWL